MYSRLTAFCLVFLIAAFTPFALDDDPPILGFDNEGARAQRALEAQFESYLDANNLRSWMKTITAKPHHVGSNFTKEKVAFMAEKFRSWGYEVEIEEFTVLFPKPRVRVVELVAPTRYKARLDEPAIEEDASSNVREDMLPPYNAYSADGDVTAELVYVNQGIPRDYEELKRLGIDVEGKIVIARYGGSWRGIKPKVAAEHGAIGCILYSDPRDDGYFQGDAYPKGPYRPSMGAQRGSVADMPQFPGDPLTPGVGSEAGHGSLRKG